MGQSENKYVELSSLLHKDIEPNQDWVSNDNETRSLMFLGVVSFLFVVIYVLVVSSKTDYKL